MTAIGALGRQLKRDGIQMVTLESTSDYWRIWFYVLEAAGLAVQLVNATQARNLPGRPKTDKLDSVWLAKITERGSLPGSFVPPEDIRRLRTHTRYRRHLTQARTAEKARCEKLLEDAHLKLSSVITDIHGVAGRNMLTAIIGGERNPRTLAQMALTRMRGKIPQLEEALDCSFFTEEHAFILAMMLANIDHLTAQIKELTSKIETLCQPYLHQIEQLDAIPGYGVITAQDIIGEIGVDMAVFPTAGHLCSWARQSPQVKESGGKRKGIPGA
jgi:transposase